MSTIFENQIKELEALNDDWGEKGWKAPTPEVIQDLRDTIRTLKPENFPLLFPQPDGGIRASWAEFIGDSGYLLQIDFSPVKGEDSTEVARVFLVRDLYQ